MKCLLAAINAKYIHSNLGVYSLRAYGEKHLGPGVEIQIGEYTINHSQEAILADIYRRKPDVVGFSCYIWNIDYVKQLLADLPKVLPHVRIWLGGPEASYSGEGLLSQFPQIDLVMKGEGEETFCRLLSCLKDSWGQERSADLSQIPGIVYRDVDGAIKDTGSAPLMDLDTIPFPYRELQDMEHRILYYESSRGCPFSCSYCLSSLDKRVRLRSLKLVEEELSFFLERRVPQVKFVDRTFNCRKDHAMAIWRFLAEHDNGVTNFHFEISADLLDEEELALFRTMRPGLIQLETGVQTANPRTLAEIRRKTDLARIREMTLRIHEFGNIHQHLDLIAGLPWEDKESFLRSFDVVYAMKPDQLQLGFLKVLKGSFMEEQKEAYGIAFTERPPFEVLSTRWLSYEDVLELKGMEEMVEVYYNSGQFSNTIRLMESLFDRPCEMFLALGAWHEEQGLRDVGHSRLARYEQLFWFLMSRFSGQTEEFRWALTVDYYLRENAGTRPSFAAEPWQSRRAEQLQRWETEGRQSREAGLTQHREMEQRKCQEVEQQCQEAEERQDRKAEQRKCQETKQRQYREVVRRFYQEEEKNRRYLHGYEGFDSRQLAKMTHLEVIEEGRGLLFDYRNRDPLTKNARLVEVPL